MLSTLARGWIRSLDEVLASTQEDLVLCCPYITEFGVDRVLSGLPKTFLSNGRIQVITSLTPENIASGATSPSAIRTLVSLVGTEVSHLSRLHAKVYIFDKETAVVTSANLTHGGLSRNAEYGVRIDQRSMVEVIASDVAGYCSIATRIPTTVLSELEAAEGELRDLYESTKSTVTPRIKRRYKDAVDGAK